MHVLLLRVPLQAWGPVASLNESQVVHLACICQGFNLPELSSLPISSLDTLEALAPCSWTQTQVGTNPGKYQMGMIMLR